MVELSQIAELLRKEFTPIHVKLVALEENFKHLTTSCEHLSANYDQLLARTV